MSALIHAIQVGLIILKLSSFVEWPWFVVLIIWESFGTIIIGCIIALYIFEKIDPKGYNAWRVRRALKENNK